MHLQMREGESVGGRKGMSDLGIYQTKDHSTAGEEEGTPHQPKLVSHSQTF